MESNVSKSSGAHEMNVKRELNEKDNSCYRNVWIGTAKCKN